MATPDAVEDRRVIGHIQGCIDGSERLRQQGFRPQHQGCTAHRQAVQEVTTGNAADSIGFAHDYSTHELFKYAVE